MNCSTIIGIRVSERSTAALAVQELLTQNGCLIKTRLGLHEGCTEHGLILLQVCGEPEDILQLEQHLRSIPTVKVSSMSI
jgi:hypothetical protein